MQSPDSGSRRFANLTELRNCTSNLIPIYLGALDVPPLLILVKFVGAEHQHQPKGINFTLIDYLELVDWTGRVIRADKRGAISGRSPTLLASLELDDETWIELASCFGKNYHGAVGSLEELALFAEHTGKRWISGQSKLRRIFH